MHWLGTLREHGVPVSPIFDLDEHLTDEQVLIYNSFMSKRGWRDDETDGFIPDMIKKYAVRNDGSVITDFDLIEMDEGRWYPEMWRDAWKST